MTMTPTSPSQRTEEGTVRVLHVDDEPDFSEMVSIYLEREDDRFAVETATSASEGLDQLSEQAFDCVISDYDMPGCNGIDFLEEVREEYPDLPFILFTGKGTEEVASDAISAGVTEYLQKQASTDQYTMLANTVSNAIEHRRCSQISEQRNKQLQAVIGRVTDAIVEVDSDWQFTLVNHQAEELYEMDEEYLLGRDFWEVFSEALGTRFEEEYRQVMETREPTSFVEYFSQLDGTFDIEAYPMDNGGIAFYFVEVPEPLDHTGVTDRGGRERALREVYDIMSNRKYSFEEQIGALLEFGRTELDTEYGSLSEIQGDDYVFEVVAADDESIQAGDIVPVSTTICEFAARSERTIVYGDVARDAPEATDRAIYADWGITCYIGAPVFVDDEVYGTFCFYDTDAKAGQFSEWEVTLIDLMSRWVSYELQRRQMNAQLLEKNEQLEQFASIVSHDLRNPLTVASGQLELASEEYDSEHLEAIGQAHDRMDMLIGDLLTLAREGEDIAKTTSVDLASLVEGCWANVETTGTTLVAEIERAVQADESRLEQVFENLIRNAIEHGGEDLTVTVGVLADGFYIEDDGPGIPPEARNDIFEAGYSTTENGTGFGLSIVKQIVDAHGWSLRVTEGADGGARFEITGTSSLSNRTSKSVPTESD